MATEGRLTSSELHSTPRIPDCADQVRAAFGRTTRLDLAVLGYTRRSQDIHVRTAKMRRLFGWERLGTM